LDIQQHQQQPEIIYGRLRVTTATRGVLVWDGRSYTLFRISLISIVRKVQRCVVVVKGSIILLVPITDQYALA